MAVQKSSRSALVIAGLGFGVALGVAAGTMVLAPNMEGTSAAVASDDPIREEHRALLQENKEIQAQSDSADSLISGLSADALAGSLEGRDVSIIATGDAAEGDVAGVRNMLNSAGAVDSGTITMTNEFLHPEGADKIKSIVANVLPAGAELDEQIFPLAATPVKHWPQRCCVTLNQPSQWLPLKTAAHSCRHCVRLAF